MIHDSDISPAMAIAMTTSPAKKPPIQHTEDSDPKQHESSPSTIVRTPTISETIRRNPRTRLYVKPLEWTQLHLDLLGISFQHVPPGPDDEPTSPSASAMLPSIEWAMRTFMGRWRDEMQMEALQKVLIAHNFDILRGNLLPVIFNGRSRCTVSTDSIFYSPSNPTLPKLPLLNLDHVRSKRRNLYIIRLGQRGSGPIMRLNRKRFDRIKPRIPRHDPYIAAILIALAQNQWKYGDPHQKKGSSDSTNSSEASDIVTPSSCFQVSLFARYSERLYLYEAAIPLALVKGFHQPTAEYPTEPIIISYRRVFLRKLSEILLEMTRDHDGDSSKG